MYGTEGGSLGRQVDVQSDMLANTFTSISLHKTRYCLSLDMINQYFPEDTGTEM